LSVSLGICKTTRPSWTGELPINCFNKSLVISVHQRSNFSPLKCPKQLILVNCCIWMG
jgi:hypothetical protein